MRNRDEPASRGPTCRSCGCGCVVSDSPLRRHDLVEDLVDLRVLAEYQIKEGPDTDAARGILRHEMIGSTGEERRKAQRSRAGARRALPPSPTPPR